MKIAAHDWMHIKVDSNSKQQSVSQPVLQHKTKNGTNKKSRQQQQQSSVVHRPLMKTIGSPSPQLQLQLQ